MKIVHFIPPQVTSTKKIIRDAVEQPVRALLERLEDRRMLSVSLNAQGFTVVTPSSDSRMIYVAAAGSDSNSGLSPSAPVHSIAKAYSLLRNGYPDWILFNRGDTFTDYFASFNDSGRSVQEPMVVTDYGNPALPRPLIDAGPNTAFRMGSSNSNVDVIGISFTSSTHNPNSPNFDNQGSMGFYDLGGTSNLLIEDCYFGFFIFDITLQGFTSPLYNVTIRRCQILDAYSSTTAAHSEGLYADTNNGLYIEDNTFDHDGWNSQVSGGQATIFNHDCYLHSSNNGVVVTNNIFADAGSFGLQARSGGIVEDNVFINDPYGWSFGLVNGATTRAGGVSGEAIGNIVIGTRQDASGWGIGAMIGNLKPGGNTVISDNIFADAYGVTAAIDLQPGYNVVNPQQEAGLNTVTLSDNIVDNWGFGLSISKDYVPGGVGQNGLTQVVIEDNDFQNNTTGRIISHGNEYDPRYEDWSGNVYSSSTAPTSQWFEYQGTVISLATWQADVEPTAVVASLPFVNPNVSVASYMASQGLTASLTQFIQTARASSANIYNPIYTAAAIVPYLASGFVVDTTAPVAVAAPPPDITPDNYTTTPNPTFTVTYTDNVAVNPTTIGNNNLTVTGVGGLTIPVSLVSTSGSGASITATYQLSAPNNDWTTVPYGTYVIALANGQIKDTVGNVTPGQPLGTFAVTVNANPNAPIAGATTPDYLNATAGSNSISLSWADSAGDEQSYILQRALDANFTQQVQNFPLTADAVSYVDTSVATATTYYYQLIAVNPMGLSAPTTPASAAILPPAPAYSSYVLDDGNPQRTAITSLTLTYTQPITLTPAMLTLIQNPATTATAIPVTVNNPTGDGRTWIVTWATSLGDNALPTGNYSLTLNNALIADAFGQSAGANKTINFIATTPPVVTGVVYGHIAPPHTLSFTFDQDVSASLSTSALSVVNGSSVSQKVVSVSWNAATLTATFTFAGALGDGTYTATLSSSIITNAYGTKLDGLNNGIANSNYVYSFTQVAPTLTVSGKANANVGAPYALTLGTIVDAGETSPSYLVHWGDGTTSSYSAAGAVTHGYASTGAQTITVDVVDANGTHAGIATQALTVAKPSIALSGGANANPQAVYTLTLGAVSDPGFTASQYIVHWGDGSTSTYTTTGAVQHTYGAATASTSNTITVDLVDNSGAGGSAMTYTSAGSLKMTLNAYPSVVLSGTFNTNIGGTYRLTLAAPVDPGFTVQQLTVNWGDGTPTTTLAAGTTTATHLFPASVAFGPTTITVGIVDNSGTYPNAATKPIYLNPPPTDALTGNANANVGGNYTLNLATPVDTGQVVSAYTVHWGDGTSNVETAAGNYVHKYTAAGNDTITVDLTDATGVFTNAGSLPVNVTQPSVALQGNSAVQVGKSYSLTIKPAVDLGATPTSYVIHWGDGTSSSYAAAGVVTHTYTSPLQAVITADLVDATGTFSAISSLTVIVASTPSVVLSGSANTNIGVAYTLKVGAPTDLFGTVSSMTVNWGDFTSQTITAGAQSVTHVYSSIGHAVISVDITDQNQTYTNAGSLALNVNQPGLTISGSSKASQGQPYALTLGNVFDPGQTVSGYTVHWGDGSSSVSATAGTINHTYAAAGANTITVDMSDGIGTYAGLASQAVQVYTPPVVTLSGNAYANAGGNYTLNVASVIDPNGTPSQYTVNWGDGTSSVQAAGPFNHQYNAAGPATITIDAVDPAASFTGVGSLPITVDPAPTVAITTGGSYANVGANYTVNLGAINDPGYTVSQYTINWGDGQITFVPINGPTARGATGAGYGAVTHAYGSVGSPQISVSLTDATQTYLLSTFSVTVDQPTVAVSGNQYVVVGQPYALSLGTVFDPGHTVSGFTVNWGDGSSNTYPANSVVNHTYASAATDTITVDMSDDVGTYSAVASQTVQVLGSAVPAITLSGNAYANAGGKYTLNIANVFDPNGAPTQYTVDWGDGTSSVEGATGPFYHQYNLPGATTISIDAVDPVGPFMGVGSMPVTVDPSPSLAVTASGSNANVGGTFALKLGAITDPGYTVSQYSISWGDGLTTVIPTGGPTGQGATGAGYGTVTHTYAAAGTPLITVALTDSSGPYLVAATSLTVNQPLVTVSGAASINKGQPYALTIGSAYDPGQTVTGYTVHWGDGTSNVYTSGGVVSHTYSAAGANTIKVDLTDGEGTYPALATTNVQVNNAGSVPVVALSGNSQANAGGTYKLTVSKVTDANGTPSQYVVHWGDGTTTTSSTSGPFSHVYSSAGPAPITIDVKDAAGTFASVGTLPVTVNPAPTVSLGASRFTANTGGTYTLQLGAISDPGYTVSQYVIAWGDGKTTTIPIASSTAPGATGAGYGAVTHLYPTGGAENISVTITDATGTYAAAKLPIYVDFPPMTTLTGSSTATTNAVYSLTVGTPVDHGGTVSTYTIHWGDGQTTVATTHGVLTHTYTTAATNTISIDLTDATGTFAKVATLAVVVKAPPAKVVGRDLFYNDSVFNGDKTAASTADFAAIATDKQALLPGHTATFQNLSSYANGINGIIVDMTGLPAGTGLSAKDFSFKVGNSSTTSSWTTAPAPTGVTVFRGAGVGGSDRIVITFANKAILSKWLQVTVLATVHTGLTAADVFYFGNAPGDSGTNQSSAIVGSADVTVTKQHESSSKVLITNDFDFNRDGYVNATDASAVQADETTSTTALKLISV